MDWTTLIVLSIGFGMINYALALRKNRNPIAWSISGFLIGVFAMSIVTGKQIGRAHV